MATSWRKGESAVQPAPLEKSWFAPPSQLSEGASEPCGIVPLVLGARRMRQSDRLSFMIRQTIQVRCCFFQNLQSSLRRMGRRAHFCAGAATSPARTTPMGPTHMRSGGRLISQNAVERLRTFGVRGPMGRGASRGVVSARRPCIAQTSFCRGSAPVHDDPAVSSSQSSR